MLCEIHLNLKKSPISHLLASCYLLPNSSVKMTSFRKKKITRTIFSRLSSACPSWLPLLSLDSTNSVIFSCRTELQEFDVRACVRKHCPLRMVHAGTFQPQACHLLPMVAPRLLAGARLEQPGHPGQRPPCPRHCIYSHS